MQEQSRVSPTAEQLARFAEQFNRSIILEHFGARLSFPSLDRVRVVVEPVTPVMRGGMGSTAVNGGVLAAIFDLAIGCTAALIDPTRRTATIQLSMSFEQAVSGDVLYAEGWIDSAGEKVAFSSAHILDGTGKVCARCQGVIRLSAIRWASGESPAIDQGGKALDPAQQK